MKDVSRETFRPLSPSLDADTIGSVSISRPLSAAGLILSLAVLASACGGVTQPQGWATPAFQDDSAYLLLDKERLFALTLAEGPATTTWTFPNKDDESHDDIELRAVYARPIVDGNRLYVASFRGDVFALERDSGRIAWQRTDLKGNIVGTPGLEGGLLAFGTTDGHLYVLNAERGDPAAGWPRDGKRLGDALWASPVIKDGKLYVATMKGEVRAFGIDGSTAWARPFTAGGAVPEITLLGDDTLFVPSFDKRVYLVRLSDGTALYPGGFATEKWVWTRPALQGNVAFFGDLDGKVYALDITTNLEAWPAPYDAGARVKSGPLVAGDTLVFVDRAPKVHFLSTQSGQALGTVPIGDAGTVRADLAEQDGGIYAVTTKGRLFRIDAGRRGVSEVFIGGRR